MSKVFPSDKDHIIDDLDDDYGLELTEEEYDKLRKMTAQQLFFITQLFSRAIKASKKIDNN